MKGRQKAGNGEWVGYTEPLGVTAPLGDPPHPLGGSPAPLGGSPHPLRFPQDQGPLRPQSACLAPNGSSFFTAESSGRAGSENSVGMLTKAARTEGGVSALEGSSSRASGDSETEDPEACVLGTRFRGVECGAWSFRSDGPAPALNGKTKPFALNGGADPAALNGGADPAALNGGADPTSLNGEAAAESDENLLARLRDGEEAALGPLWKRYAALLYSQALGVLHNPTEAEDVVAEVFSEVWRRAAGYHPERARPVAWLVTLVRRRSIDRLRERRSYEKAGERLALEKGCCRQYANSNGEENSGDGVEEQVHLSEIRALLEQALQYLPERQRETVCMVYFHGLTQKEIAARTSTPLGTVKTRLELGLRKMRERIRGARLRSIAQDRGS